MKFAWEADDCWPGRRLHANALRNPGLDLMIFADDTIGGASRFGIVDLVSGLVIVRCFTQTELAGAITDRKWRPTALTKDADDD